MISNIFGMKKTESKFMLIQATAIFSSVIHFELRFERVVVVTCRMNRNGGKKKPLKKPKKAEKIVYEDDSANNQKEKINAKLLEEAKKKAQKGPLGVGKNKITR
ncbi:unnamed protein product [Rodentolepis nana]|uniref:Translation machinery-associated protein 7 homolog n=1 Tax=Rodentolepis nana TaxID=102285 RepID=A0A0R3TSH3_RODNA|nr:unnamed protein product [Rodentolepis nana]